MVTLGSQDWGDGSISKVFGVSMWRHHIDKMWGKILSILEKAMCSDVHGQLQPWGLVECKSLELTSQLVKLNQQIPSSVRYTCLKNV